MLSSLGNLSADADEVVECLFPIDGSGLIAVLRCGIDASTRDGGIFTVAAVTYGLQAAKQANREWNEALRGRTFHMTDLHAKKGEFEGITKPEVLGIMKAVVGVVRNYSHSVVAVSCPLDEVRDYLPTTAANDATSKQTLEGMRSTYGLMCHLCMAAVGRMTRGTRDVIYTLESGDDGQGGVIRYLDFIENDQMWEQMRDGYSFRRKTIGLKDEIEGLFHSADLVAWEWGKQVERAAENLPKRKSFELIEEGRLRYFRHFPPKNIQAFLVAYQRILNADTIEEIDNAFELWRSERGW